MSLVAQSADPALTASSAATPASAVQPAAQPAGNPLDVSLVVSGLTQPVFVTNAGDSRLFVIERTGRIRIVRKEAGNWTIKSTFLNLATKITDAGSEQGLLGLAFPPDYATSGRFYVNYTDRSGDTVVAEYRRMKAWKADPNSERVLLRINQPFPNHNGGWLGFDGATSWLYIATGDGGSGGDPGNRAQNKNVLLGKILRIKPRDPDGSGPKHYGIPSDNPFVGKYGRDEVLAFGLRNPWRNSFDPTTGDMWLGDVGQESYEEIDHVSSARGRNFGWNKVEGFHRYPSGDLCTSSCKTLPVAEYHHDSGRCSITGGYVSRRDGAALNGQYIFGDFCTGEIWHVPTTFDGGSLPTPRNTALQLSSFGIGQDLSIYAADLGGAIYRVDGT
jgi:glucose/arabinose dehydrogenase